MGSIWGGFGRLWAVLGPLWGAFGLFVGRSKSYLCKTLVQHGLQEAFWIDFGSIWEGLERIWQTLGKIWALKIEAFASHGRLLSTLCVFCSLTLCYRNPRVASLRLAERHNTRGFRPQTRVRLLLTSGLVLLSLLEWVFVSYTGFDAPYGVERGSRVSRRGVNCFWSWGHVGSLFAFVSHV